MTNRLLQLLSPRDKIWEAMSHPNSNLYKLTSRIEKIITQPDYKISDLYHSFILQPDGDKGYGLLDMWSEYLGLPKGRIETSKLDKEVLLFYIKLLLLANGLQSDSQYKTIASLLNMNIEILDHTSLTKLERTRNSVTKLNEIYFFKIKATSFTSNRLDFILPAQLNETPSLKEDILKLIFDLVKPIHLRTVYEFSLT